MVELNDLPNIAITLVLVAAVFVAGFLVIDGLDNDTTQWCEDAYTYNASAGNCYLTANHSATTTEFTSLHKSTGDVSEGLYNVVEYAPTWGTLIGVGVLLAIVLGAFFLGRKYMGGQ